MATIDLEVAGLISSTGWSFDTGGVGDLQTSDDNRATDGQKGEVLICTLDDVPGDFGSMNDVTLHVEGGRPAAGDRVMSFRVVLHDALGAGDLEEFTTADLTTTETIYDSSAFTRSDSATIIDRWSLQVHVLEGGGMPGGDDTSRVDHMWVTLDYNVSGGGGTAPYYYASLTGYGTGAGS